MFAQTLAYGLFAARCNHHGPEPFQRLGAADEIPKTNPFLRKLFEMITGTALDDEPFAGFVDDLVQLLAHTEIDAVLADFGKRTRRQDPIIHFYETFLVEYNPKERRTRGIYYTPEPVVSYIVRSIDHILKTRFGCPGGLADTATVQFTREDDEGKEHTETAPRVLILDPACGTGTFLYAVVDLIREEFMRRGDAGMWSGYVREHLLPRLFGFELLMAPYAVSHLKLGMQLAGQDLPEAQRKDWAYDFVGDERLGVYLTNTLEEAERRAEDLFGPLRVITEEANAAAKIKRDLPIMVVLGNPPYSVSSFNKGAWIENLMADYKEAVRSERNIQPLSDDYIKFIRFAHWRIETSGTGIVGLVTNREFILGLIHRGMRQRLLSSFDEIYILDLHGQAGEDLDSPEKDKNVFDIRKGVAISLFVRHTREANQTSTISWYELIENRANKYKWLLEHDCSNTPWSILSPSSPNLFFIPFDESYRDEYESGRSIAHIFTLRSVTGFATHRDRFVVDFERENLISRINDFLDHSIPDEEIATRYQLDDTRDWSLSGARIALREDEGWEQRIRLCSYRPFDDRFIFYSEDVVEFPRLLTMRQFFEPNIGLIAARIAKNETHAHFFVSRNLVEKIFLSPKSSNNAYVFCLYLYPVPEGENGAQRGLIDDSPWPPGMGGRRPNLNPNFVADVERRMGMTFVSDGTGNLNKTFGPEDIFHYMYAVFHSPTYRERYAEFLKIDFPRLPLTSDKKLFVALAEKGAELVVLHLIESPVLKDRITHYPVTGDQLVEKGHPKYFAPGDKLPDGTKPLKEGRVYISRDNRKTGKKGQYFEGVPPEVWEFHVGGYQVCNKWLKDRRGRILSYEDRVHYQKVVVALQETIRLMGEIDDLIPSWPIV
ncbi:MAG: type ISP restriction/modification enzyme [bacterium]|nr:type ISP restriction/modification enzyme [bacterium]